MELTQEKVLNFDQYLDLLHFFAFKNLLESKACQWTMG